MHRRVLLGFALIVFVAPSIVGAQGITAPGKTIVIKAARIFDGKGENILVTEQVFFVMKEGTVFRNDRAK